MALGFGPWLVGAVHYAMERRLLLGIRERVERGVRATAGTSPVAGDPP
jgi:hypothetical protein